MSDVIPFNSAEDVRKKYPGAWNCTTGKWGQVIKKTYGPYIATVLFLYGQQVRWRVKELKVSMSTDQEFVKSYRVVGAGRGATIQAVRNHIESVVLPRLLFFFERTKGEQNVGRE